MYAGYDILNVWTVYTTHGVIWYIEDVLRNQENVSRSELWLKPQATLCSSSFFFNLDVDVVPRK